MDQKFSNGLPFTGNARRFPTPPKPAVLVAADRLYEAGMNVFPVPIVGMEYKGRKPPYGKTSVLVTTRLADCYFPELFRQANLAVMTGRLSGNLFIIDCDSPAAFDSVRTKLAERGIRAWIRSSVRGGQCWLRCAEGEVANAKPTPDIDVLGTHKYSVAPPSLHPTGVTLFWIAREGDLPPLVSLSALDFLPLQLASRTDSRDLPAAAHRVLVQRDIAGYASNSEAELAAAMSLMRQGKTDDEVCAEFARHRPPHYAGKPKPEAWLRRYCLSKARQYVVQGEPQGTAQDTNLSAVMSAVIEWASSHPWAGRTAETDKAVFLAHCRRAQQDGVMPYRASVRELAELAGVNKETAGKATQRLENNGLICRDGQDKISAAYSYVIPQALTQSVETDCSPYTTNTGGSIHSSVRTSSGHDLWHYHALGKSAYSVWQALLRDGETTPNALAKATGRTVQTVKRALTRLAVRGLASPIGIVWTGHEACEETLDAIVADTRMQGRGARRQRRHADERAVRASQIVLRQKEAWERKPGRA